MATSTAALLALVYAFVVAGMAFIIGGGGHGWVSTLISSVGLVLLPAALIAWARHHRPTAIVAAALAIAADIAMAIATAREGFEYVERVFESFPVLVLAWLLLWLGWQVALMLGLSRGAFTPRENT